MTPKQTAVEWLQVQLNENGKLSAVDFYQAKEMENQQHKEIFKQSRLAEIFKKDMPPVWESWEHYYNETYNTKTP
jgi:alpha-galactosidase